jgi:heme exporter protein C
MFLGFFLVFIFSVLYLWRKTKWWDIWASSSAEVGLLFCTLVLVTGPIWAKPIWGAWWVWDAQLTLTLVLWLIYVAYMMLRTYSEDSIQSAKFRAVLGIIAFLDIPLIHYSTRLWRTHHPSVVRGKEDGLPPDMKTAFYFCVVTFLVLFAAILWKRVSLELARDELESLKAEVRDRRTMIGDA